jgi:MFS family permease
LLSTYAPYCYGAVCLLWLLAISNLMIADVWDESNALLLLASEPVKSASAIEATLMIWLQKLPLDMYRPLPNTLILVLGKLFDGNFVLLRLTNAALVAGGIGLLTSSLAALNANRPRQFLFFVVALFSSSALITSTWFSNLYDAACLFFIALSVWAYCRRHPVLFCAAMVLAIFSKESYLLVVPFLILLFLKDDYRDRRLILVFTLLFVSFSICYWLLRQNAVSLGSEQDIHSFDFASLTASTLSLLAGFVFQFNKFSLYGPVFWLGLAVLAVSLAAVKDRLSVLAVLAMLAMSAVVYWGMFGFQDGRVHSYLNFVGRLYLLPYSLFLLLVCKEASWRVVLLVACVGAWGFVATYRDYAVFQHTYREIYELAREADDRLIVHYPEKQLDDAERNLTIGDFPAAELHIDTRQGGLTRHNQSR